LSDAIEFIIIIVIIKISRFMLYFLGSYPWFVLSRFVTRNKWANNVDI